MDVCGATDEDYLRLVQDLLPRGFAWPRARDSVLMRFWAVAATEYARIHGRDCDLLSRESFPCSAVEMLAEWERALGLPDPCLPEPGTLQERQNAVCRKLTMLGGASRAYFIALAATVGYAITIEEFREFRAGISSAGDLLSNGDWVHTWRVNAVEGVIGYFSAGINSAGDPLAWWGNEALECLLNQVKPARTILLFAYHPAPQHHQGSVALVGAGSAGATASRSTTGAAAFAGAGEVQGEGVVSKTGAAALGGTGAVEAQGYSSLPTSAFLTATSSLSATPSLRIAGSMAFVASGALSANGTVERIGEADLAGAGAVSAAATAGKPGAAALGGAGAVAANAIAERDGRAALTGSGALTANGVVTRAGAAALAGAGTQAAAATVSKPGATALSGAGTVTADGVVVPFFSYTIASSTNDVNLRSVANAGGYAAQTPAVVQITINSGVVVGSTSTSSPGVQRGTWPAGVTVKLVNNGVVAGKGGTGASSSSNATAGGPALDASAGALTVDNQGEIRGGGGGGGRGQTRTWSDGKTSGTVFGGEGGGGAGAQVGPRDSSGSGNNGNDGTATAGGAGGTAQSAGGATSGTGGTGGAPGQAGNNGNTGSGGSVQSGATSGGAAGAAVNGNSNITWIATGTRQGAINS